MKIAAFFLLFLSFQSCRSQSAESHIVLVAVDTLDRGGIADEIAALSAMNPRVITIDITFLGETNYDDDTKLMSVLLDCKELVMISFIEDYTGREREYSNFEYVTMSEFLINAKTGFSNTILEDDDLSTLRRFSIFERVKGEIEYHIAIRTAMSFDSLTTIAFIKDHPRVINVDYKNGDRVFKRFSSAEVLRGEIKKEDISGKIVLVGGLGPTNEDKFFSPLNPRTQPLTPDVFGLEYIANIIAQVLEHRE